MTVVRHSWQILVCSECGEMDTDEAVCGFCESSEGVTLIEVVPADQLQGAVKERDEWRRISAEQQADYGQLQAENERLRAEVARLTTTGGQ